MHRLEIDHSWENQSVTEINVIRMVRECPSTIYHVHDIHWVICAVIKRVFKRQISYLMISFPACSKMHKNPTNPPFS